jgi:hypothetical protein
VLHTHLVFTAFLVRLASQVFFFGALSFLVQDISVLADALSLFVTHGKFAQFGNTLLNKRLGTHVHQRDTFASYRLMSFRAVAFTLFHVAFAFAVANVVLLGFAFVAQSVAVGNIRVHRNHAISIVEQLSLTTRVRFPVTILKFASAGLGFLVASHIQFEVKFAALFLIDTL